MLSASLIQLEYAPSIGKALFLTQRLLRGKKSEMATWPTCGQRGYITPTVLGVPNAQRGENNHKWLCGRHVGKGATSPLPSWGPPPLNAGGKIRNGYVAHMWAKWVHHPCRLGVLNAQRGDKNQKCLFGHLWAKWLYNPCCLGGPECLARGQKSQMSIWSTCGQGGHITPAILAVSNAQRKNIRLSHGSPTLSAGTEIRNVYVAHMWAKWLHHPCRLGGPQRSARGEKS